MKFADLWPEVIFLQQNGQKTKELDKNQKMKITFDKPEIAGDLKLILHATKQVSALTNRQRGTTVNRKTSEGGHEILMHHIA